jgi:dTDP-4-amino-4,6-dideoxygalactose transaminase
VVQRGGVPVFVDIRPDTLNVDETLIESAVTPRTKAIIAVHYAGVCAEMDAINAIGREFGLIVIEDAAHAMLSSYRGRMAGGLGDLGCFSFHETKNVVAGEGGAMVFQNPALTDMAAIIADKGNGSRSLPERRCTKLHLDGLGFVLQHERADRCVPFCTARSGRPLQRRPPCRWAQYHESLADLEAAGTVQCAGRLYPLTANTTATFTVSFCATRVYATVSSGASPPMA